MERRRFLESGGALGAAAAATVASAAATALPGCSSAAPAARPSGKTFVLVHGAWHGAWSWERLTPLLRARGHEVRVLTLAGVGERIGEISTAIDLETHIADVTGFIRSQDLRQVVLVGHSYGGYPITGALDRLAAERRIDTVVYLDAFAPHDGERMLDYLDATGKAELQAAHRAGNPRWPKLPAKAFGLGNPADIAWVDARLTDHPNGTYLQPISLRAAPGAAARKRLYIAASAPAMPVFDAHKARLRNDPAWTFVEVQGGHDAMVDHADTIARLLDAHA